MQVNDLDYFNLLMQYGPGYGCLAMTSAAELPPEAQDAFAATTDFARDCMDVFDVASKTEILGCGNTLDQSITALAAAGFCLCGASTLEGHRQELD